MSKGGRYLKTAAKPAKKMSTGMKIGLTIVSILLIIMLALLCVGLWFLRGGGMEHFLDRVQRADEVTVPTQPVEIPPEFQVEEIPETTEEGDTEPTETEPTETWPQVQSDANLTTFLLVGQNYRAGPDGEESYLSDSMIMVTINRETKTMTMTSIMRDLYVILPAYAGHTQGQNRINVNYHLGTIWTGTRQGGMEMLAKCVEQNFGIPIDHTVEVDFEAFEKIINMMGGVEIDITEAEAKYLSSDQVGYIDHIEPGLQTLNGLEALAYARIRKIDGDEQRTGRQRNILMSLLKKCMTMSLFDLRDLAYEILPMVTTDMETEEMKNYILEFLPMLTELKIVSQVLPIENAVLRAYNNCDSNWPKKVIIGGIEQYVIACNTQANGQYLREQLGYDEPSK